MEAIKQTLIPDLQSFAQSNDLTKVVFEALAKRERAAARSDIDAIFRELTQQSKKEIDYTKYMDIWKSMEEKKLGTLVRGRLGNPNRFVWKMNFREVGKAGLGMIPIVTPPMIKKPKTKLRKKPVQASAPSPELGQNTITFVLPDTVPVEEILALISLGTQLASKADPNTNKK